MTPSPPVVEGLIELAGEREAVVRWLFDAADNWKTMPLRYAFRTSRPVLAIRIVFSRLAVQAAFKFAAQSIEAGDHLKHLDTGVAS